MPILRILFVTIVSACFISCSSTKAVETTLYFGMVKPSGRVSENDWRSFANQHINKVYPNGSTVIKGEGSWYDTATHSIIREETRLVVSVNKMTPQLSAQIDSLRFYYKQLFNQQSVLRTDRKVKMKMF